MPPSGKASVAPACVCTSPISWLALPPPLPHALPRPPPLLPPLSPAGLSQLQGALAPEHGVPAGPPPRVQGQPACRCAGGWGGPAQWEEVGLWAQSPPWSSQPGPSLSEVGWAGELQREEGEGLTVWDGRSRGRRTGAPPSVASRTLGGKALTRRVRSALSGPARPSSQPPAGCALRAKPLSPNLFQQGAGPPCAGGRAVTGGSS